MIFKTLMNISLLMINMLWWFLKISKIHPCDRPYACDHLYNWFEGCFILVIIIMPHLYDHYNASFEGCFFTEPDHTTENLVKRDCPATANILTLSNWSATSLLRFCRKSSDFWKVFRLSDSSQIFGRFQARWKFLWPGTWHWLGRKCIIRVSYDVNVLYVYHMILTITFSFESSTHILRNEKLPLRFCLPLDLPQIM